MLMRLIRPIFFTSMIFSGCYVTPAQEEQDRRAEVPGKVNTPTLVEPSVGECHFGAGRGCFDAFLSSRRALNVAGKSFFNADDLAARFQELVMKPTVEGIAKPAGSSVTVHLDTPIDQATFIPGFEFELNGATKRSGRIRPNGVLNLHDLVPGTYDLRLMRLVRYTTVTRAHDASEPETQAACAILFADNNIEIQSGQRAWENISDFQIQVIGPACGT